MQDTLPSRLAGQVLGPGPAGHADDLKLGIAVLLWDPALGRFRCWYCCRDHAFDPEAPPPLGTGHVAYAESADGIGWVRVNGAERAGAVLAPSTDRSAHDSLHVGVADVLWHDGRWWLWSFGGDRTLAPNAATIGLTLRPGLATSPDGLHWTRQTGTATGGALVDPAPGDLYQAWQNVVHDGDRFVMYATAMVGSYDPLAHKHDGRFATRIFTSRDARDWQARGELQWLDGERPWDQKGMVTRHVLLNPFAGPRWLMLYTALNGAFQRSIGCAVSADGLAWTHLYETPIFEVGAADAWDGLGVANPRLVVTRDALHLYYFGFPHAEHEAAAPKGMGLAMARDNDLRGFRRHQMG